MHLEQRLVGERRKAAGIGGKQRAHDIQVATFDCELEIVERRDGREEGALVAPEQIARDATGEALGHAAFMRYLRAKYGELYDLVAVGGGISGLALAYLLLGILPAFAVSGHVESKR